MGETEEEAAAAMFAWSDGRRVQERVAGMGWTVRSLRHGPGELITDPLRRGLVAVMFVVGTDRVVVVVVEGDVERPRGFLEQTMRRMARSDYARKWASASTASIGPGGDRADCSRGSQLEASEEREIPACKG